MNRNCNTFLIIIIIIIMEKQYSIGYKPNNWLNVNVQSVG